MPLPNEEIIARVAKQVKTTLVSQITSIAFKGNQSCCFQFHVFFLQSGCRVMEFISWLLNNLVEKKEMGATSVQWRFKIGHLERTDL